MGAGNWFSGRAESALNPWAVSPSRAIWFLPLLQCFSSLAFPLLPLKWVLWILLHPIITAMKEFTAWDLLNFFLGSFIITTMLYSKKRVLLWFRHACPLMHIRIFYDISESQNLDMWPDSRWCSVSSRISVVYPVPLRGREGWRGGSGAGKSVQGRFSEKVTFNLRPAGRKRQACGGAGGECTAVLSWMSRWPRLELGSFVNYQWLWTRELILLSISLTVSPLPQSWPIGLCRDTPSRRGVMLEEMALLIVN